MPDKVIFTKWFESGKKAIVFETKAGAVIEFGGCCILIEEKDLYGFIRLLKEIDEYYLKK